VKPLKTPQENAVKPLKTPQENAVQQNTNKDDVM
jgi:hypothetical protein